MKNLLRASVISCAAFAFAFALSTAPAQAKNDNRDIVRAAQVRLADLGYSVGNIDGVAGDLTEHALKSFQHNNGLLVTGHLTPETYNLLINGDHSATASALYQNYENYYHTTQYNTHVVGAAPVAWGDRWHYVRQQELPIRFGHLNVQEDDTATLRHYVVTLNGHSVFFAKNQPAVLRASNAYALNNEDAIIFTAFQGSEDCPNKSYLLVVHSDGTYNKPYEIGNCTGSYEAHIAADSSLMITAPGSTLAGGWQTWSTWRYAGNLMVRL